jgi:micrococcal nuclease
MMIPNRINVRTIFSTGAEKETSSCKSENYPFLIRNAKQRFKLYSFLCVLICGACTIAPIASSPRSVLSPATVRVMAASIPTHSASVLPDPTPISRFPLTRARVAWVVDGDTIFVSIGGKNIKLRYIGINTPETVKKDWPVEWMGPEANQANKRLVDGKTVWLEKDVSEVDQYDRILRYVYLEDGRMVNELLVCEGFAQVSTFPPDVRYVNRFLVCQRKAQAENLGLWSGGNG